LATLSTGDPICRQPTGNACTKTALAPDNGQVVKTYFGFIPNALDRNIEAGLLVRDRALSQTLASHFQRLNDTGLFVPLPAVP